LFFALLALLFFSCVLQAFAEASEAEARADIDNVGVFLEKAYLAVADAEAAGANGTQLKTRLNYAGALLADASASFEVGNFSAATAFALLANDTVKGISDEAYQLKAVAEDDRTQRFYWSVLESSMGLSLAVFAVLVGWIYFKRHYVRRVLDLKPEVSKSES
jgi:glycyl-tRNA synthetase (class II)